MVRKSSDEVKIEITESEGEENYWNLRDSGESDKSEYNMSRRNNRFGKPDWERRHHKCSQCCYQEGFRGHSHKNNCERNRTYSSRKEKTNSLRIQFDLDEERRVTEDQKQMILNTITDKENLVEKRDHEERSNFEIPVSVNLITLIALLAFLAVLALILGSGHNGFYY